MKKKYREFLEEEKRRRVASMTERVIQAEPLGPWLPPGWSRSALRRLVARLRAGVICPVDSEIPPDVLAAMIEKAIEQHRMVKSLAVDMMEYAALYRLLEWMDEVERKKRLVASFHRLKKSPEANDPESPVAQRVRRFHRERRNAFGRPRRRRKRG